MTFHPSTPLHVVLLVLVPFLQMGGCFTSPAGRPSAGHVRCSYSPPRRSSTSEVPGDGGSEGGPAEPVNMNDEGTQKRLRDSCSTATDAVSSIVEKMTSIEERTTESLSKLSAMVNVWDDQVQDLFTKTFGETSGYDESMNDMKILDNVHLPSDVSSGLPPEGMEKPETRPDKKDAKAGPAPGVAESPVVAVADTEGVKKQKTSSSLKISTNEKNSITKATVHTSTSAKLKGSAEGTVRLDRPTQVQNVFDDIQRKAVEFYHSSPVAKAAEGGRGTKSAPPSSPPSDVASPVDEEALRLEARLESLLDASSFRPRKLTKALKQEFVYALDALESIYPESAKPLADPALNGQWVLIFSSHSRVLKRMVQGLFSIAFQASEARQVVDASASVVINACRARLRFTPMGIPLAQKGPYQPSTGRKVTVNITPRKKKGLGRFLPSLRPGEATAEVTYLSNRWRICRVGGVTVAFRKSGN